MRIGYVCGGNTKIHDRFYAEESKNEKSKKGSKSAPEVNVVRRCKIGHICAGNKELHDVFYAEKSKNEKSMKEGGSVSDEQK